MFICVFASIFLRVPPLADVLHPRDQNGSCEAPSTETMQLDEVGG